MGHRDDRLTDDERAEAALRRALALLDEPSLAAPPPDLVTRSARRLPAGAPAQAARAAARAAWLRRAGGVALVGTLLLVALLGSLSLTGMHLALLFGDGGAGLSRGLLTLQLLAKPLWRAASAIGTAQVVAALAAITGGAALWWRLVRRSPIYAMEHAP